MKDILANEFKRLYVNLNHIPSICEIEVFSNYCWEVYRRNFRNMKNLLNYCGFDENVLKDESKIYISHSKCLSELYKVNKKYYKKYGNNATYDFINFNCKYPPELYIDRYGSLENTFNILDIKYNKSKEIINDYIVKEYIDMSNKVGHSITVNEYDYYCAIRTSNYIIREYGNFINFQNFCGIQLNSHGKPHYNKEELSDKLLKLYNEINRKPTQADVDNCDYLPSTNTISHYFGSLTQALKYIGIPENVMKCKEHVTPNGTLCLSRYEYLFARMLETKNIKFEKEVPYRKYIPDLREWWRFDFEVELNNNIYLVEIFGITENEDYYNKIKRKKSVSKENKLSMICIYPDDIMYKNYDEIYDMFINKVISFEDELDDLFDIDE